MFVATFKQGGPIIDGGPLALRPLSVLLGIVAQLLIIGCSGIARRFALLGVGHPHIECRLPVRGTRSTPVRSSPTRRTLVPVAKALGFVLAGTSSW